MRSRKLGLEEVVDRFESWRSKPHGKLIPAELWKLALELLDRHSPSTICSRLRLNAGRFKEMREARGIIEGERNHIGRVRAGGSLGGPRPRQNESSGPEPVFGLVHGGRAFLELPPLGVGGGLLSQASREGFGPMSQGCRLTLESAGGTLSLVTAGREHEFVEAVCRLMLVALTDRARA